MRDRDLQTIIDGLVDIGNSSFALAARIRDLQAETEAPDVPAFHPKPCICCDSGAAIAAHGFCCACIALDWPGRIQAYRDATKHSAP